MTTHDTTSADTLIDEPQSEDPAAGTPIGEYLRTEDDFHFTTYARLFSELYGTRAKFVLTGTGEGSGAGSKLDGHWIVWDEDAGHWEVHPTRARELARELAVAIYDRACFLFKEKVIRREVRKLLNNHTAILVAASDLPEMVVSADELDANPFLLKVKNGTLDLTLIDTPDKMLREDDPDDLITKCAGVAYDPEANAPMWQKYLDRVMPDPELQEVLQSFVGYSLCGDTSMHTFWLLEGESRTGKGVFKNVCLALLGDYAYEGGFAEFISGGHRKDGPRPGLLEMLGKRAVLASESSKKERLDDSLIKGITGSDVIRVRGLYERSTTGKIATFKVALLTNHAPVVEADDQAIWERVRRVPFEQVIPLEERDPNLRDKLVAEELPGILNWALEGYRYWHRNRSLPFPEALRKSNEAYRAEMDPLALWIEEHVAIDPDGEVMIADLHRSYSRWAQEMSEPLIEIREFGKRLRSHPALVGSITPKRNKHGRGFTGIRLIREAPF